MEIFFWHFCLTFNKPTSSKCTQINLTCILLFILKVKNKLVLSLSDPGLYGDVIWCSSGTLRHNVRFLFSSFTYRLSLGVNDNRKSFFLSISGDNGTREIIYLYTRWSKFSMHKFPCKITLSFELPSFVFRYLSFSAIPCLICLVCQILFKGLLFTPSASNWAQNVLKKKPNFKILIVNFGYLRNFIFW